MKGTKYTVTSKKLSEFGLSLHGSGNQSEDAQRMWKKFEETGWVSVINSRRVLQADRISPLNIAA